MNSGQPNVVVLGAQGALGRLCVPALRRAGGKRLETQVVLSKGNFAMSAAAIATCAKVLLDRRAEGDSLSGVRGVENVFRLSEVRGGFEEQGIRIEAMT